MPRVQLSLPSAFIFKTEIEVRVSDINYGGHLGNDTLLTLLQEARVRFYRQLGFKNEISFEGSIGQIIADAAIQYKAESFLGDILVIQIGVSDFTRVGFDMNYRVTNKETGKDIAIAKTGIICFDYSKKKVSSIPQDLLAKLQDNPES
ncbi:MAG TPA: thioesterase family protein [Chryseolinea sp.]|nr:thioesterase family protein [Chryseolinea sp.]